jgi:protein-disulfide isomerase
LLLGLIVAGVPATTHAKPAPGQVERVEYHDPATPPTRGPSYAPVTIEVFFVPGPTMPANALRLLQQVQQRHPKRSRLVYRILKSGALFLVPSAMLEAHAEGKFFEMMDELGKQRTALRKEDLLELARKAGVDPQRVALATQSEYYSDLLEANQRRFDRLHAGNTPSVLFNGRPTKVGLPGFTAAELDREYQAAYDRALDKLERGFTPGTLPEAFDGEVMLGTQPPVTTAGTPDDDPDRSPADHPLASPPLQLEGLPSFGKPGVTATVPVIVLCRPNDAACNNLLRVVEPEMRLYPEDVRIVWSPWFDVNREDAVDLTLLGDAALCAEVVGSNQGELTTSPGWVWVKEMYAQFTRNRGPKPTADKLIDAVATKLDIDVRVLSACRATMAGSTLGWVAASRHAGVPRSNIAVVIGGRIYEGLTDQALIHALVEAELAPGVLGSLPRWHTGK